MLQFRIDGFNNYVINVRRQVFRVNNDGSTRVLKLRNDGRYGLRDDFGNEKYRTPDSLYWSTMDVVRHSIPSIRNIGHPYSKYMIDKDFNVYNKLNGLLSSSCGDVMIDVDNSVRMSVKKLSLYTCSFNNGWCSSHLQNVLIINKRGLNRLRKTPRDR